MNPERWERQQAVFSKVQPANPEERVRLLDTLCGGDDAFRREIEELLRNHDLDDSFLSGPMLDGGSLAVRPEAGTWLAGRFELLRLLGEGGMGQVWAARDHRLNDDVAIKTIHPRIAGDKGAIERFKRELQLARRVAHANVCRLYELFEEKLAGAPLWFLTMELLAGETLAARLDRGGRIEPSVALDWTGQLCAAVSAAHSAGIVHRDLKPGNIMLVPDAAGQLRPVIMDFGLARVTVSNGPVNSVTASGLLVGTPEYMAPEQIRGDAITAAADLYALGLILYEMLNGARPFSGKNTLDSWMRRIREGPPALGRAVPGLPRHIDAVIARCLEFEPRNRFASAAELAAAIEDAPGWPSRLSQPLATAAAVAAMLIGVWVGWPYLMPGSRSTPEALLWYRDARRDLAEGAAVRASNQLRRAIAASPGFPAAYAALAEAQIELDQLPEARETVLRAADLRGAAGDRAYVEGVRRLLLRDCPAAVSAFRSHAAAVEQSLRPYALTSLARAQERCEQAAAARQTLTEAAKLDPRNAAVLVRSALLAHGRQDLESADRALVSAEALYRELNNFEGVAEVLLTRGTFANERDQLDQADAALREAMGLARTTRSVPQQIRILFQQSNVARRRGELAGARGLADQAVRLATQNGLETLSLKGIFAAANIHTIKNQNHEAVTELQRALEIARRYRDEENQARASLSLAVVYQRLLQPDRAEQAIAAALPYYRRVNHARNLASANYMLGQIEFEQGRFATAAKRFSEVLDSAKHNSDANLQILALQSRGRALIHTGDLDEAGSLYDQAFDLTRRSGRKRSEAYAVMLKAEAASLRGKVGEAASSFALAQKLIAELEPDARVAPANYLQIALAGDALRRGQPKEARRLLDRATVARQSPHSGLEALSIEAEALLIDGDLRRANEAARRLASRAEAASSRRHLSLARLWEVEIHFLSGRTAQASSGAEALLRERAVEDSPADYLIAQWLAAGGTAQGRRAVSQILADLRLKMGDEAFRDWSRRADINRRLTMTGHNEK
ncbi:MAG: protein kinase [Bryobacteraceae bacterium]|nr:protein kinase [Bryobacteraceae bacterium]